MSVPAWDVATDPLGKVLQPITNDEVPTTAIDIGTVQHDASILSTKDICEDPANAVATTSGHTMQLEEHLTTVSQPVTLSSPEESSLNAIEKSSLPELDIEIVKGGVQIEDAPSAEAGYEPCDIDGQQSIQFLDAEVPKTAVSPEIPDAVCSDIGLPVALEGEMSKVSNIEAFTITEVKDINVYQDSSVFASGNENGDIHTSAEGSNQDTIVDSPRIGNPAETVVEIVNVTGDGADIMQESDVSPIAAPPLKLGKGNTTNEVFASEQNQDITRVAEVEHVSVVPKSDIEKDTTVEMESNEMEILLSSIGQEVAVPATGSLIVDEALLSKLPSEIAEPAMAHEAEKAPNVADTIRVSEPGTPVREVYGLVEFEAAPIDTSFSKALAKTIPASEIDPAALPAADVETPFGKPVISETFEEVEIVKEVLAPEMAEDIVRVSQDPIAILTSNEHATEDSSLAETLLEAPNELDTAAMRDVLVDPHAIVEVPQATVIASKEVVVVAEPSENKKVVLVEEILVNTHPILDNENVVVDTSSANEVEAGDPGFKLGDLANENVDPQAELEAIQVSHDHVDVPTVAMKATVPEDVLVEKPDAIEVEEPSNTKDVSLHDEISIQEGEEFESPKTTSDSEFPEPKAPADAVMASITAVLTGERAAKVTDHDEDAAEPTQTIHAEEPEAKTTNLTLSQPLANESATDAGIFAVSDLSDVQARTLVTAPVNEEMAGGAEVSAQNPQDEPEAIIVVEERTVDPETELPTTERPTIHPNNSLTSEVDDSPTHPQTSADQKVDETSKHSLEDETPKGMEQFEEAATKIVVPGLIPLVEPSAETDERFKETVIEANAPQEVSAMSQPALVASKDEAAETVTVTKSTPTPLPVEVTPVDKGPEPTAPIDDQVGEVAASGTAIESAPVVEEAVKTHALAEELVVLELPNEESALPTTEKAVKANEEVGEWLGSQVLPTKEESPAVEVHVLSVEQQNPVTSADSVPPVPSRGQITPADPSGSDSVESERRSLNDSQIESFPISPCTLQDKIPVVLPIHSPNSPYTPSFLVTAIGHGPIPDEPGASEVTGLILSPPDESAIISPEEVLTTPVIQINSSVILQAVDEALMDGSQIPVRPWTPSYSVHSQGSPLVTAKELDNGESDVLVDDANFADPNEPELEEMKFAKNTEQPEASVDSPPGEPQILEGPQPQNDLVEATRDPPGAINPVERESNQVAKEEVSTSETILDEQSELQAGVEIFKDIPTVVTEDPTTEEVDNVKSMDQPEERSQSPHWVPSYSVSTQGSPLPETRELDATIEAGPSMLPIYEPITSQDCSVSVPPAGAESSIDEAHVQHESLGSEQHLDELTAYDQLPDIPIAISIPPVNTQDSQKDMWTPSYSVTTQGVAHLPQEKEVAPLDVSSGSSPAAIASLGEALSDSSEPRPEITSDVSNNVLAIVEAQSNSDAFQHDVFERLAILQPTLPGRHPSERVSEPRLASAGDATPKQTAVVLNEHTAAKIETPSDGLSDHIFPSADDTQPEGAPDPKAKPVVPRLVPLEEYSNDTLSPELSARKRLESTTSSRFFPGGWFSSSSTKSPDESRPSLELAQGEFIPAKSLADGTEAIVSAVSSTTTESFNDAREADSASSEEKRKWCIIM